MTAPFYVAIPARSASTRLPNKPLLEIAGRPMLQWVYEHACESQAVAVAIAAGDEAVVECAQSFGAPVWLTRAEHSNGTMRLGELMEYTDWPEEAVVVNVQADEPLLPPELMARVAHNLAARPEAFAASLCEPLQAGDWERSHVVKVWRDADDYAIGFSRHPQSELQERCCRHLGIYAYRRAGLQQYAEMPVAPQEQQESLEQWRLLHQGLKIHVDEVPAGTPAGVDTPEDLARVRAVVS